jgi:hypothetical protein
MDALVDEGLCLVINSSQTQSKTAFKLPEASVRGKLAPGLSPSDWQQLEQAHVVGQLRFGMARATAGRAVKALTARSTSGKLSMSTKGPAA